MRSHLLFLGCLSLTGCALSTAPSEERTTYVGTALDTDAVLGGTQKDAALTLYLCGGSSDFATRTHWFSGEVGADGTISIDTKDGWRVRGAFAGLTGSGTIQTPDDEQLAFSLRQTGSGEVEGLYAVDGAACRTGVVVTQPSSADAPQVQGTWCDGGGRFAQVTPILPIALTPFGLHVSAMTPHGEADLYAVPVRP